MKALLRNLRVYSEGDEIQADLRISKGKIVEIGRGLRGLRREKNLNLSGYLALPGLINAHDHLEFNLFPKMGNPPYDNFYEWARDIYRPGRPPVKDILQVPLRDRLLWGGYKNLFSGVTTVVHHNPYYRSVFRRNFPVRVLKRYGWSHSLGHGKNVKSSFKSSRGKPFFIHAGEGVDSQSIEEISRLSDMGLLANNTVIVHGIALQSNQIERLSKAGTSLVWCPSSNNYLFGQTLDVSRLGDATRIALGTDSTMSGSRNLLDELRAAFETNFASSKQLLEMVTTSAASVCNISDGRGTITPGSPGDIILLQDKRGRADEILLKSRPSDLALVIVAGEVRLANDTLAQMLDLDKGTTWNDGERKWVYGDFQSLRNRIRNQVGETILQRNDLWQQFELRAMDQIEGSMR